MINALRVAGRLGVQKAQEEVRVDIVVRGYRRLVGAHLPEQQRLEETPRRGERVKVAHRLPQLERAQHVAVDVDVAAR